MTFYSNHFFKIWKWSKTWIKVCYARYEWNSYWFRAHVSGKRGCLGAKVAPSGDASSHSSLARSSPFVSEQNGSDRTVYAFQIMPQLKEDNAACGARVLSEASLQRRPLWYSELSPWDVFWVLMLIERGSSLSAAAHRSPPPVSSRIPPPARSEWWPHADVGWTDRSGRAGSLQPCRLITVTWGCLYCSGLTLIVLVKKSY